MLEPPAPEFPGPSRDILGDEGGSPKPVGRLPLPLNSYVSTAEIFKRFSRAGFEFSK
jgi:hypothetical protein